VSPQDPVATLPEQEQVWNGQPHSPSSVRFASLAGIPPFDRPVATFALCDGLFAKPSWQWEMLQ
jgi:hypothetical protein